MAVNGHSTHVPSLEQEVTVRAMGRKSEEPIEKKKLALFVGDFERLGEILAPRNVTPSVFIRHLVRRKLRQLEAVMDAVSRPTGDIDLDDIIQSASTDPAADAGESTE